MAWAGQWERRVARAEGEGWRGVGAAGRAALTASAASVASMFTPCCTRRVTVARSPTFAALIRTTPACWRSHPLLAHHRSQRARRVRVEEG